MKFIRVPNRLRTNLSIEELIEYNNNESKLNKDEEWKQIYFGNRKIPSNYSVSSKGQIRNDKTNRLLRIYTSKENYQFVTLYFYCYGKLHKRRFSVHELVAAYFCPIRKKKLAQQVHHINPKETTNNNYWNLIWVSVEEHLTIHDKLNYYNPLKGEDHPNSTYTNSQIEYLCQLMESNKYSNKELEEMTDVKIKDITLIRNGLNWKSIASKYTFPKLKEANRKTKFYSEKVIHKVCKLLEEGYSNQEIAIFTKMKSDTISKIRRGKLHKNISSTYNINYDKKGVYKRVNK